MNDRKQNDLLKSIAMISMLIDHIGMVWFPEVKWMRLIGRIAFPIFAFGIARGIVYSSDKKKYILRLLLFSIIAQIPFFWLSKYAEFQPYQINQIAQLLYSALVLILLQHGLKCNSLRLRIGIFGLVIVLAWLPDVLVYYFRPWEFAYGSYGVIASILFYLFTGKKSYVWLVAGWVVLSVYYHLNLIAYHMYLPETHSFLQALGSKVNFELLATVGILNQDYSIFSVLGIIYADLVNREYRMNKWIFYLFYPIHIACIVLCYHLTH